MAIGKDKTQVLLTLTKEDKAELQRIADNENRSFTNEKQEPTSRNTST